MTEEEISVEFKCPDCGKKLIADVDIKKIALEYHYRLLERLKNEKLKN